MKDVLIELEMELTEIVRKQIRQQLRELAGKKPLRDYILGYLNDLYEEGICAPMSTEDLRRLRGIVLREADDK